MRTLKLSLLAIAALVLLLPACGGDGGPDLDTSYPPAGEDRFENTRATVEIEVKVESVSALPVAIGALQTIDLEGPTLVTRGDPQDKDGDGLVEIETEIISMELTGTHPTLGNITVRQDPERRSMGMVEQQEPGQDFPADSFFDVFHVIELPDMNLTAVNEDSLRLEATLTALPPGEADDKDNVYRRATDEDVPLIVPTEQNRRIGRIVNASHVPNPPPEEGETPTPTPTPTDAAEPAGPDITEEQLGQIASRALEELGLVDYERNESLSGVVSNDERIAGALDVKEAPKVVEEFGRTTGYDVVLASPTNKVYQIRLRLDVIRTADGASGYLENRVPYLQGAVGMDSAHEGTLQSVEGFTPDGTLENRAVGATLKFGDAGQQYYETYVAIAEVPVLGSVSLFTTRPPDDEIRNQALELIIILRAHMLESIGE